MDGKDERCKCNGGNWRCSGTALPGMSFCHKHKHRAYRGRKMVPVKEGHIGKGSEKNEKSCTRGAKEQVLPVKEVHVGKGYHKNENMSKSSRPVPRKNSDLGEKRQKISNGKDIKLEEDDCVVLPEKDVNGKQNGDQEKLRESPVNEGGTDPNIVTDILKKAKELGVAVNESIQANAAKEELLNEVQKCMVKYWNTDAPTDEKNRTRFELPFFERSLEQWKYKYVLKVIESLTKKSRKALSSKIYNLEALSLRREDLFSLRPTGWLSAGVIGAYATLITDISTDGTSAVHIVNSFLYSSLPNMHEGYNDTVKCDFSYKVQFKDIYNGSTGSNPKQTKILVPVNLCDRHWGLIMVDVSNNTITVLDAKFVGEEAAKKYEKPMEFIARDLVSAADSTKWIIKAYSEELPKLSNEYDSGVFVLACMECIARGIPVTFENDFSSGRLVILSDLLDHVLCGS